MCPCFLHAELRQVLCWKQEGLPRICCQGFAPLCFCFLFRRYKGMHQSFLQFSPSAAFSFSSPIRWEAQVEVLLKALPKKQGPGSEHSSTVSLSGKAAPERSLRPFCKGTGAVFRKKRWRPSAEPGHRIFLLFPAFIWALSICCWTGLPAYSAEVPG